MTISTFPWRIFFTAHSDRATLTTLAGSLAITSADVREILTALPADLEQAHRDTVQTALQLVGKVTCFWGSKSRAIGWDSRWGQLSKAWAAGSSTTGTYRPFGLDCSGFADWTFNNSLGYIIGHGGGARAQHTYCANISQSVAQPGDLAFYPDDSHVGIIAGRNAAGKLLVCHCSRTTSLSPSFLLPVLPLLAGQIFSSLNHVAMRLTMSNAIKLASEEASARKVRIQRGKLRLG